MIALGGRRNLRAVRTSTGVASIRTDAPDPAAFDGADAVVHLAGESVAGRWNAEKKRRIAESRIDGTRTVAESLRAFRDGPPCSSAHRQSATMAIAARNR